MNTWIQNIAILIGILLLAGAAYFVFVQQGLELNTSRDDVTSVELQAETQSLLQQLRELRSVDLSTEVYSSDRFQDLTNYNEPPQNKPTGRTNPFARSQ